jgi:hypothetical protein
VEAERTKQSYYSRLPLLHPRTVYHWHCSTFSYRLRPGLHQRQKRGVANVKFVKRSTSTMKFMSAVTSTASGVASAHWPEASPTPCHKYHLSQGYRLYQRLKTPMC